MWPVLRRALHGAAMGANAIGTLMVLVLVLVITFDVIARSVFNAPFLGAVEVVQFSLVFIVFAQLPDVVRAGRLTRSDGLLILLGGRAPRLQRCLHRCIDTLAGALMAVIAIAIWPEFIAAYQADDYFGTPGIFTAPWWPLKGVIFVSACLCAALFALRVVLGPDMAPTPGEPGGQESEHR
ncbi:MAG: TRAP transporter small permease subunit [Gammaproteobacteria bacterium]|nr:TRAP transporter small permease subunit [Gammaproteobacteria bacterium]